MPAAAPEKRVNGYLPQGSERSLWWQQTENRADRTGSRQETREAHRPLHDCCEGIVWFPLCWLTIVVT
jgi:hypothetical protein